MIIWLTDVVPLFQRFYDQGDKRLKNQSMRNEVTGVKVDVVICLDVVLLRSKISHMSE